MGINFKPRFKLKAAGGDSALNKRGVNLHDVYLSVLPGIPIPATFSFTIRLCDARTSVPFPTTFSLAIRLICDARTYVPFSATFSLAIRLCNARTYHFLVHSHFLSAYAIAFSRSHSPYT